MDPELLARIQFALTAGFHFLFPPLSIGLGVFLVVAQGFALKTKDPVWRALADFWTKIFALVFAFGVATGIVLEFEFGTNWARYSRFVGDVFGSPLAAEAIFAFFMESCFLGIVLFGRKKVSEGFHYFSVVMVCLGAHLSALWILVANSWMQTPAGFTLVETENGPRAEITNFWAMVFNPSTLDRLWHVLTAAWLTGAFLVLSVSAWHLLKKRGVPVAERGLKTALAISAAAIVLQFASGHASAMLVEKVQPVKFAAMEGVFDGGEPAGFHVVGWVDEEARTVRGLTVPGVVSVMLGRSRREPSAAAADVSGLPLDGLLRRRDVRARGNGNAAVVSRAPARLAPVARAVRSRVPAPAAGESGGLDRDGGRAPAVDRAGAAEDEGRVLDERFLRAALVFADFFLADLRGDARAVHFSPAEKNPERAGSRVSVFSP